MNRCFDSDQGKVVHFSFLFPERTDGARTKRALQLNWIVGGISAYQRHSMSAQFGAGCWPLGFSRIRPILVDVKVFAQFWFQTPKSPDGRKAVNR